MNPIVVPIVPPKERRDVNARLSFPAYCSAHIPSEVTRLDRTYRPFDSMMIGPLSDSV